MSIPPIPRSTATPRPLKAILGALILLFAVDLFLPLRPYLGLSLSNLTHGYFWTLLTYPFASGSRDFLSLCLDLFFLWILGATLIDRLQSKNFLLLFFGSTLFTGLAASLSLYLLKSPLLFSQLSPILLSLFTAWTLLHANRDVHITTLLIVRTAWIFAFFAGFHFLFNLLESRWIEMIADITGLFFGYFFCVFSQKVSSPFSILFPFERRVLRSMEKIHPHKSPAHTKIYDFQTGEPVLEDIAFMDAMLARISLHGEQSISPAERKRMQEISERKASKK
ncbi:MAG: rhomboid family intramembrane serine protease [Verrucomicrobiota bacterium]|nr:rhomboid family intramembrane serine protease [Verrucomicrobiota bacterium]